MSNVELRFSVEADPPRINDICNHCVPTDEGSENSLPVDRSCKLQQSLNVDANTIP